MVYFKTGIGSVKTYDLCQERMIYLRKGCYILNIENDHLSCISHNNIQTLDLKDFDILQFYIELNVDFGRDSEIKLSLDNKGVFNRMDGINGSSYIETLFD